MNLIGLFMNDFGDFNPDFVLVKLFANITYVVKVTGYISVLNIREYYRAQSGV